jgi:hypothetical protein
MNDYKQDWRAQLLFQKEWQQLHRRTGMPGICVFMMGACWCSLPVFALAIDLHHTNGMELSLGTTSDPEVSAPAGGILNSLAS